MVRPIVLPSEARRTLLDEHARLRRLLGELEDLAGRLIDGDTVARQFEAVAEQFRRAVDAHNHAEETALEPVLRYSDAWGKDHVEEMFLEHVIEHSSLLAALEAPNTLALARAIPAMAVEMRAHMEREETTFLTADLLRDDLVTSGGPTS